MVRELLLTVLLLTNHLSVVKSFQVCCATLQTTRTTTYDSSVEIPRRTTASPPPLYQSVTDHDIEGETIRERIHRIRSGRLTEEEKRNFLETTLRSNGTVRASLKAADDSEEEEEEEDAVSVSVALTTTTTKRSSSNNTNNTRDSAVSERDRIKREWVDRILDPARFAGYAGAKKQQIMRDPPPPSTLLIGTGPRLRATRNAPEPPQTTEQRTEQPPPRLLNADENSQSPQLLTLNNNHERQHRSLRPSPQWLPTPNEQRTEPRRPFTASTTAEKKRNELFPHRSTTDTPQQRPYHTNNNDWLDAKNHLHAIDILSPQALLHEQVASHTEERPELSAAEKSKRWGIDLSSLT